LYCLIAFLGWSVPADAQFGLNVWTTEHGLPQNVVRAVGQSRDGYIWVVTMDGVARFDGVRFTVFDRTNSPSMRTNRYTAFYESGSGLWFGSVAGATRYRDGAFTAYTTEHGLPGPLVSGITGNAHGEVWMLSNETVVKWHEGRFEPEPAAAGISFV